MDSLLEKRRAEIRQELAEVEDRMGAAVHRIRSGIGEAISPSHLVKNHLAISVLASVAGGMLLSGILGRQAARGVITRTLRGLAGKYVSKIALRMTGEIIAREFGGPHSPHPE